MALISFKNIFLERIDLEYHDELNKKLWDDDILRPMVKEKMLKYAEVFRDYCRLPEELIYDIYFTGGNCSYSYNGNSDLDIHLVVDKSKLGISQFIDDYLWDKKKLFSINYPIFIEGYACEPYVQDQSEHFTLNQGVYSILHDIWIQKPTNLHLNFQNDMALEKKVNYYHELIDHTIDSDLGIEAARSLKQKITSVRGEAIARDGEYAFENLVFKQLRSEGSLDKIDSYIRDLDKKNNYGV